MSNQAQSGRFYAKQRVVTRRPRKGLMYVLLAAVFLLVATSAYWLTKKNSTERSQEEPLASTRIPAPAASAAETPTDNDNAPRSSSVIPEDEQDESLVQASTRPLTGAYKVRPARAYFHSSPDINSSTGKYVLRGDVVYAEGESETFIKTRYFNADGDPVAGWLKKSEVQASKAAAKPAPSRATATSPRRPSPEVASAQPEKPAVVSPQPKETPVTVSRQPTTGTVRVDTTYFYDSPDLTQRRRAFCIRGDKMKLTDSSDQAVFATFVNWEKVRTSGWIRKRDLNIR